MEDIRIQLSIEDKKPNNINAFDYIFVQDLFYKFFHIISYYELIINY